MDNREFEGLVSETVKEGGLHDAISRYEFSRKQRDELKEAAKVAEDAFRLAESRLFDALTHAKVQKVTVDGVSFSQSSQLWASAPEENTGTLLEMLEPVGLGRLVKMSINSQSLSAICRRLMEISEKERKVLQFAISQGLIKTSQKSLIIRRAK